jgi:hypothetical protein
MGMKPRKKAEPKAHEIQIVQGNLGSGMAIYLNGYRIAGNKPWGGGTTVKKFNVSEEDLNTAQENI